MLKKLLLLMTLLLLPIQSYGAGIDLLTNLIPNRVGIKYMFTTDDYSIPGLCISAAHPQLLNKAITPENNKHNWQYNFSLPSVVIDAEGELGIGGSIGLAIYDYEYQVGFYGILGKHQHEGNNDYRAYLGVEIF